MDSYPDLISTTFANVPADLHELLSTAKNLPEQWQRSASYESEKVKSEKRKIQMYCDFQPAFLFLLTQGTKRKRSSAMLIMKRSSAKLIIKQKYII